MLLEGGGVITYFLPLRRLFTSLVMVSRLRFPRKDFCVIADNKYVYMCLCIRDRDRERERARVLVWVYVRVCMEAVAKDSLSYAVWEFVVAGCPFLISRRFCAIPVVMPPRIMRVRSIAIDTEENFKGLDILDTRSLDACQRPTATVGHSSTSIGIRDIAFRIVSTLFRPSGDWL